MVNAMSDKDEQTILDQQAWAETCRKFYDDQEQHRRNAGVLNAGERQVREMHDAQQIPALPPAVQARWDDWCDARCKEMIESALGDLSGFLGGEMGKIDAKLKRLAEHSGKRVGEELVKMRKEFTTEIVKLRRENAKLRKEMGLKARGVNVVDLPNPIVRKQQ
jgi:hypothetical protein